MHRPVSQRCRIGRGLVDKDIHERASAGDTNAAAATATTAIAQRDDGIVCRIDTTYSDAYIDFLPRARAPRSIRVRREQQVFNTQS